MDFSDLGKIIQQNKKTLVSFALFGVLVGGLHFIVPPKYISTGSLFVTRNVEQSTEFFTYEGYYGQQSAVAYTNTVASLLESTDLQSKALEKLNIAANETNLRKYRRFISIKKRAPQLITLSVKEKTPDQAQNLWLALSDELLLTTQRANAQGDRNLTIVKVSEKPISQKEYRSLWINIPAGLILGSLVGSFFILLKKHG